MQNTHTKKGGWPRWLWRFVRPSDEAPQAQDEAPMPTDYGHGYEAKELVDGRWVLWHNGEACDLKSPGYTWKPSTRFFRDCMGTRKQVDAAAKEIMSARGVFRPNGASET